MTDQIEMSSEKGQQTIDSLLAKMSPEQQVEFKAALAADKPVHVHVAKDGTVSLGEAAQEAAATAAEDIKASESVVDAAPEAPVVLEKKDHGTIHIEGKDLPIEEVNGKLQAKDENGNVYAIGDRKQEKRASKIDMKRQQILQDRMKRHMGRGLTQQQAFQAVQREDYEAMPIDKKFARLETIVSQSFQNLAQEIIGLNQSHIAIADAFDVNYRAIQKLFKKLGVSDEDQKAIIAESEQEVIADKKRKQDAEVSARDAANLAQMNKMRAAQEASEQKKVETELKQVDSSIGSNGVPPEGAELPKEATVFGG